MNLITVCKKLRERGLRITPLKKQIVELFIDGACGLSARDVHDRLPSDPHISTVHRCLGSLEKAGFLRPDRNSEGLLRYRCSRAFYPDHGHFRCDECGRRFPVSCSLPDEFIKMIERAGNFEILSSDFFLEGTCRKCSKK
jgi:Fur family zinc uptake transcriptional regulator/Fur family ferric uptake transcriptional regulator